MRTPTTPTLQDLRAIQRKLDAWELQHLREHAAALALLLESAQAEIEQLQGDLIAAEAREEMFSNLAHELQQQTSAHVGITTTGHMGVLQ